MKYLAQTSEKSFLIRLMKGEDILLSLQKFCREHQEIGAGKINGIGAVSQAVLGFYDGCQYLENHFGFGEIVETDGNLESKSQIIHRYNVGRIPGFSDGLLRFQDEVGFWKRVIDFGMVEKEGKRILRDNFKPQSEERFTDKIGEFYIANNGLKIYEKFKS